MRTALVAGATGLVGGHLLDQLLASNLYERVIAITRHPLEKPFPHYRNVVADLDSIDQVAELIAATDVFCCLGTTIRKARSEKAFRKVDFDYPVKLASLTKSLGAKQFLLISALGASKKSAIFYNRVKGDTEEAISEIGFETFHILRPSLLLGHRLEPRTGEAAAVWFYKNLGFLIPKKFKAIEASQVAQAMVNLAILGDAGKWIHENKSLLEIKI